MTSVKPLGLLFLIMRFAMGLVVRSFPSSLHRRLDTRLFSASDTTKYYKISGRTSSSRSGVDMVTFTGHSLETDVPITMGGKNLAPQPVETLLAALIGCTQATALFVGRQLQPRVLIERMEFDIEAERDERGALSLPIDAKPEVPSRLQRVSGIVVVYAKQTIDDSTLSLLKEQTELRCPVANMMHASGCEMNIDWMDGVATDAAIKELLKRDN